MLNDRQSEIRNQAALNAARLPLIVWRIVRRSAFFGALVSLSIATNSPIACGQVDSADEASGLQSIRKSIPQKPEYQFPKAVSVLGIDQPREYGNFEATRGARPIQPSPNRDSGFLPSTTLGEDFQPARSVSGLYP